jgi:predicted enzyme related to lactoylglutathione lyase
MTSTSTTPIATVSSYAIWAADGRALAEFYAAALGTSITQEFPDDTGTSVAFLVPNGPSAYVFYTAQGFTAPNWPADDLPFHLDLTFDDVHAGERRLLELGASKPDFQPGGEQWTVLLDPSGQPFCISRTHSA